MKAKKGASTWSDRLRPVVAPRRECTDWPKSCIELESVPLQSWLVRAGVLYSGELKDAPPARKRKSFQPCFCTWPGSAVSRATLPIIQSN